MATDEVFFAYQYVGQEVELVTLMEVEDIGSLEEDSEGRRSEDKDNTDDVNEMVCGVEERRDGTAELEQPSMVMEAGIELTPVGGRLRAPEKKVIDAQELLEN